MYSYNYDDSFHSSNEFGRETGSTASFDYILGILIICGIQALAFAFFTVWKDKEKRSRTHRFVFSYYLALVGMCLKYTETSTALGGSFFFTLGFFIWTFFYNLVEYIAVFWMILALTALLIAFREEVGGGFGFFGMIAGVIFVWNRKDYLEIYRFVFTTIMAFTSCVGSLIFLKMESPIPFFIVLGLSIASASFISYVGWTKRTLRMSSFDDKF